jgi:hypothetical protein
MVSFPEHEPVAIQSREVPNTMSPGLLNALPSR